MQHKSPFATRYTHLTHYMPIPSDPDTHGYHAFILHNKRRTELWHEIREWCEEQFGPQKWRVTWKIDEPYGYFTIYDDTLATAFKLRWCR